MSELVIVDYGMANLRSVQKAFERFGHSAHITSDPKRVAAAGKLVLPGVGAFRDAIARLRRALSEYTIGGIRTNRAFFDDILGDAAFRAGQLSTAFIEEYLARRNQAAADLESEAVAALVAALAQRKQTRPLRATGTAAWLATGRESLLR